MYKINTAATKKLFVIFKHQYNLKPTYRMRILLQDESMLRKRDKHRLVMMFESSPSGALAGQLCTDARTNDCKSYPKQCVRHFEIDTHFHCVQSKSNPFKLLRPSQGLGEQGKSMWNNHRPFKL